MLSVLKMMKEQGNQFDWSQIAIDILSLPCFKPLDEWDGENEIGSILKDGYQIIPDIGYVVRVTGDHPSVDAQDWLNPVFTDCEPVVGTDNLEIIDAINAYEAGGADNLIPFRTVSYFYGEYYFPERLGSSFYGPNNQDWYKLGVHGFLQANQGG